MRRAQSAMEFLSTYGWAIMVTLIAFGALFYFGFIDFASNTPDRCELWPEFSCDEVLASTDGTIELSVRNNLGHLRQVNFTLETDSCTLTNNYFFQSQVNAASRLNQSILTFSCQEELSRGTIFDTDVLITYVEQDMIIPQRVEGRLRLVVR